MACSKTLIAAMTSLALMLFQPPTFAHEPDLLDAIAAKIEISITPGKPGAPTETLAVGRKNDRFHLVATRTLADSKKSDRESIEITEEQFAIFSKIVQAEQLTHWLPQQKEGSVDLGESRFRIEWRPLNLSKANVHDVGWTQELREKGKTIATLKKNFANLAESELKRVKIHYFR